VRFLGTSHCETSPDGTYAHATGAGVGVSLHVTLPSVPGLPTTELGSVTVTLPDLDFATVKVPKGGIPPTDGPGGNTGGNPNGSTNGGNPNGGNTNGNANGTTDGGDTNGSTDGSTTGGSNADSQVSGPTNTVNGGPSEVDAGLLGTAYDVMARWTLPIGAGVAFIVALAYRQYRRLHALD